MADLIHKSYPVTNLKLDDAQGVIEAIVSVTNNKDRGGERVMPGFFAKSLQSKMPRGVWCHDWTKPIAKTLVAEEWPAGDMRLPTALRDFGGYYIKGQFNLETQRGKEAYSDLKFGTIDEFSIGFKVNSENYNAQLKTRDLIEGEWFEWSPVLVGMNPATAMLSIKSADSAETKGQFLGEHIEASMTMGACGRVVEAVYYLLIDVIYDDEKPMADRLARVAGAYDEARDLTVKVIQAILSGTAEDTADSAVQFIQSNFLKPTEEQSLRVGLTLAKHSEKALAAVQEWQSRIETVSALRLKEGRVLSSANRTTIKQAVDDLTVCAAKLQELYDATDPNAEDKGVEESNRLFSEFLYLDAQLSAVIGV